MERKRRFFSEIQPNMPQKRLRISNEDINEESGRDYNSGSQVPLSVPFTDDTDILSQRSSESTRTLPEGKAPYSTEFFLDLADTVAQSFPYETFAEKHNCDVAEVSQAICATIIGPLADFEFEWHKERGLTPAAYGRQMITIWKEHFRGRLEATGVSLKQTSDGESCISTISTASRTEETLKQDETSECSSRLLQSCPELRNPEPSTTTLHHKTHPQEISSRSTSCSKIFDEVRSPTVSISSTTDSDDRRDCSPSSDSSKKHTRTTSPPGGTTVKPMLSSPNKKLIEPRQRCGNGRSKTTVKSSRSPHRPSNWRRTTVPVVRQRVYKDIFGNYIPIVPINLEGEISIPEKLAAYTRRKY